jgi:hypothetical protein
MLSVDISFLFHLVFIFFCCQVIKQIFFVPLYDAIFLDILHVKAFKDSISKEIDDVDQKAKMYQAKKTDIVISLKQKIRAMYIASPLKELSHNIDKIAVSPKSNQSYKEDESNMKETAREYATSIMNKISIFKE